MLVSFIYYSKKMGGQMPLLLPPGTLLMLQVPFKIGMDAISDIGSQQFPVLSSVLQTRD